MNWIEVSLTVSGELAEAVADVLARHAPNGVTTEQAVDFINDEDEGTPSGPITVRAYLADDELLEEQKESLLQGLHFLGMIQPLPEPAFMQIKDQNWMEAWKSRYQPIPIGKRLIIVPAWLETPDASRIAIKIDPGMAFGTGTHPTTQLCLELIEEACAHGIPERVIDVGCGSGILSIAALKLGAAYALGVDIDELSVTASRENARANGIADERFILGQGSVQEIMGGKFLPDAAFGSQPIRSAPVVAANILAPVIIRLFQQGLADLVDSKGVLLLSGILEDQVEDVLAAAGTQGMELAEKRQVGDWAALLLMRSAR